MMIALSVAILCRLQQNRANGSSAEDQNSNNQTDLPVLAHH
jgi:hypothetical protein